MFIRDRGNNVNIKVSEAWPSSAKLPRVERWTDFQMGTLNVKQR